MWHGPGPGPEPWAGILSQRQGKTPPQNKGVKREAKLCFDPRSNVRMFGFHPELLGGNKDAHIIKKMCGDTEEEARISA